MKDREIALVCECCGIPSSIDYRLSKDGGQSFFFSAESRELAEGMRRSFDPRSQYGTATIHEVPLYPDLNEEFGLVLNHVCKESKTIMVSINEPSGGMVIVHGDKGESHGADFQEALCRYAMLP